MFPAIYLFPALDRSQEVLALAVTTVEQQQEAPLQDPTRDVPTLEQVYRVTMIFLLPIFLYDGGVYESKNEEFIVSFKRDQLLVISGASVLLLLAFAVLHRSSIRRLDTQIKRTRWMLLLFPEQVRYWLFPYCPLLEICHRYTDAMSSICVLSFRWCAE